MALLDGDWSIAANGDIRSVANSTTHEVLELHRWLMDKLDNATSSGDDLLDVTNAIIPSVRSTDQIITLNAPYNIDDAAAQRFFNGSITQDGGNTIYSGLQVVGSVNSGTTELQIVQNNTLLTNYWGTGINVDAANNILLQMLVKTRSGGTDIDGRRIRVQARELGDTYAFFNVTLGLGVSVAAVFTQQDDFNQTAAGTIAGWTNITNLSEGHQQIDIDQNGASENYYSQWDKDTRSTNDMYERAKWATRRGTSETLYGMNGELFLGITHSVAYDTETGVGPWVQNEVLSWGTGATAGTGALLAIRDDGTTGVIYLQLLTGVAPTSGVTLTATNYTANASANAVARTVNGNCFLGNYTGSLTGAFGVGVQQGDLGNTDSVRALDDTPRNPPNNVSVAVTGLVSGDIVFSAKTKTHSTTVSGAHSQGDTTLTLASGIPVDYDTIGRIVIDGTEHIFTGYTGATVTIAAPGLVSALAGGEAVTVTQFYNDEFTADTAAGVYNGSGDTVIQATAPIGLGFPTSGVVRVWNTASGIYEKYTYSGVSGQQLTGITPALSRDISTEPMFIPYIDESATGSSISKTVVHSSDVAGRHRVYNASANIVPFEVGFTIGAAGASTQAIRNSDA